MKIGFIQNSPKFGEVDRNVKLSLCETSRSLTLILIVLPELFNTGYRFRSKSEALALAESIPNGPTTGKLDRGGRVRKISLLSLELLKRPGAGYITLRCSSAPLDL